MPRRRHPTPVWVRLNIIIIIIITMWAYSIIIYLRDAYTRNNINIIWYFRWSSPGRRRVHGCPVSLFRHRVFGVYASPTRRAPVPPGQRGGGRSSSSRGRGLDTRGSACHLSCPVAVRVCYTHVTYTRIIYPHTHTRYACTSAHGVARCSNRGGDAAQIRISWQYNIIASVYTIHNTISISFRACHGRLVFNNMYTYTITATTTYIIGTE
jgi:hypothetical protein